MSSLSPLLCAFAPLREAFCLLPALFFAVAAGCSDFSTTAPTTAAAVPDKEPPEVRFQESRFFRGHDMFLSADNPRVAKVAEVTLEDDEEVLGFVVEGKARAYRVGELCYHHVINDQIGDHAIAVTY